MANGSSFLGRAMPSFFVDYANQFGINQVWNFFSPDPSHTSYLEYEIRLSDMPDGTAQDPILGSIPPEKKELVIDSSKRRMLHSVRFLSIDPKRFELLLGPWICKMHKDSVQVKIKHILEPVTLLDRAILTPQTNIDSLKETISLREFYFECKK